MISYVFNRAKIGDAIKRLRKFRGITQKELAIRSQKSRAYVYQLENGRIDIRLDSIMKFSEVLGFRVIIDKGEVTFLGGKNESYSFTNESRDTN